MQDISCNTRRFVHIRRIDNIRQIAQGQAFCVSLQQKEDQKVEAAAAGLIPAMVSCLVKQKSEACCGALAACLQRLLEIEANHDKLVQTGELSNQRQLTGDFC